MHQRFLLLMTKLRTISTRQTCTRRRRRRRRRKQELCRSDNNSSLFVIMVSEDIYSMKNKLCWFAYFAVDDGLHYFIGPCPCKHPTYNPPTYHGYLPKNMDTLEKILSNRCIYLNYLGSMRFNIGSPLPYPASAFHRCLVPFLNVSIF